jgi:hypothetical protein
MTGCGAQPTTPGDLPATRSSIQEPKDLAGLLLNLRAVLDAGLLLNKDFNTEEKATEYFGGQQISSVSNYHKEKKDSVWNFNDLVGRVQVGGATVDGFPPMPIFNSKRDLFVGDTNLTRAGQKT